MSSLSIVVLAAGAFGFKAAGVIWSPDARRTAYAALIPPALFAGLIVVATLENNGSLAIDARMAGTAAAIVAAWRRASFVVVVLVAMAVTALVRLIAG